MGHNDTDGSNNDIRLRHGHHDGIFTRSAAIGPGLQHLSGGDGVCPQGNDFHLLLKQYLQSLDDRRANAPSLAVYNTNRFNRIHYPFRFRPFDRRFYNFPVFF